ncbi:DUF4192 domain-containing protein [Mumia zhuanghuii]|uniref:DUF4192 domain-containing protein n=2 Tax=Mumia TaxID=1546255 RepID=A0ABW1QM73_9ACTN|nr:MULTISPECIES: DUF4192 domain-containing protein [Mumia]KAA1423411.1 DUF4192 domain-containing protein [Mumia zhuanghuii]
MTEILRARTLSDLIGVVPALFGFHPQDSLVAICLDGPSGQAGFRLRSDLPPVAQARTAARALVGYLAAQEPAGVVLIAFATADRDAEARAVVDAMTAALTAKEVRVTDAVRYDGDRYFSYSCDDPRCCPPEGVPCAADSSLMLAEAVYRGLEVLPSRDDLVRRFAPVVGPARRKAEKATAREAAALERRCRASRRAHGAPGQRVPVSGVPVDGVPVDGAPGQRDPEVIRHALDRVLPIVDRVLLRAGDIATDVGGAPSDAAGGALSVADKATLSVADKAALSVWTSLTVVRDVLWSRITHDNAAASLAMWREVGVSAVAPFQAAPLTLAAFSAWLSGDGAQAQCALDRVEEVSPAYSMAELIQTALTRCIDPRAWPGLPGDDILRVVPGLS